jgi:LysR family transcriptional regulator, regulator of gene expression of beta-lactamase
MDLNSVSLNTLRAFSAAARHLSFTHAGKSLFVTQAAVSHQVKALENQLGAALFRRTTKGLVLTDEGHALAPVVEESLGKIERLLDALSKGAPVQVLNISVVGTFALGFLVPRLALFRASHPQIDLRLMTNNNTVDMWAESLDYAIRFGDGAWQATQSDFLTTAPISPLCSPEVGRLLHKVEDLAHFSLLRSFRARDWPDWLEAAQVGHIQATGPVFDTSMAMVQAASLGEGIALAPPSMFGREVRRGDIIQPFSLSLDRGSYWLTKLLSKPTSPAMEAFKTWLLAQIKGAD